MTCNGGCTYSFMYSAASCWFIIIYVTVAFSWLSILFISMMHGQANIKSGSDYKLTQRRILEERIRQERGC